MQTACAFCLVMVPGLLFQSGFSRNLVRSVACAPHVSIAFYCLAAVVMSLAHIPTNAFSLLAVCTGVGLVGAIVPRLVRARKGAGARPALAPPARDDVAVLLAFVLVGIVASVCVYYASIYDINAPVQSRDNLYHYSVIRSLTESTDWSTLHVTVYPDGISPTSTPAGFYPIAWHTLATMLSSLCGLSPAESAHIINFTFMSLVFSTGSFYFLRAVLGRLRHVLAVSALVFCFNAAFPWLLFCVWPLFPNAASLCLAPAVTGVFLTCLGRLSGEREPGEGGPFAWALFVVGAIALAVTQPNAIFTCAAILAPYCVYASYRMARHLQGGHSRVPVPPAGVAAVTAVAIAAIWLLLTQLPMLQGVVQYYWQPITSIWQACVDFVLAAYPLQPVQLVTAALVLIGAVYTLMHPRYLWLLAALLLNGLIYVVSASFGDNVFKHVLSGFWYTDPYRTAANLALASMPLLCLGMFCVARLVYAKVRALSTRGSACACTALLVAVVGCLNYTPFFEVRGAFAVHTPFEGLTASCHDLTDLTSPDDVILTQDKVNFLGEVSATVGNESLIANCPFDGSAFAYASSGLNVYYRRYEGVGAESESEVSSFVRSGLSEFRSSEEMTSELRDLGFRYVLVLDRDFRRMERANDAFDPNDWVGLFTLDDATPGFNVVLSQGDMRLYEIVYPE